MQQLGLLIPPAQRNGVNGSLSSQFQAREMLVSLELAHYLQRVSFVEELSFSKIKKKEKEEGASGGVQ